MSLAAILACLLAQYAYPVRGRQPLMALYGRLALSAAKRLNAGDRNSGILAWVALMLVVLGPLALVSWLASALHPAALWLVELVMLYGTLRFMHTTTQLSVLEKALREGDVRGAANGLALWRGEPFESEDPNAIARLAAEHALREAHHGTFGPLFWFLVLPVGFLLGMYTQTGYDASAHTAEETTNAAKSAAQGVWRSIFWSAVIGWFVLLAFLFAANDVAAVNDAGGAVFGIFNSALDPWAAKMIVLIATVGQFFCGAAGLTSASRTWYAFSRDRGMPGWAVFRRVNRDRVPFNAVIAVAVASLVIAIPALFGKNDIPFAFFALPGICTVGLYLAYIIPVYLRFRRGDSFQTGPWNLGRRYKIVNVLAILFVIVVGTWRARKVRLIRYPAA